MPDIGFCDFVATKPSRTHSFSFLEEERKIKSFFRRSTIGWSARGGVSGWGAFISGGGGGEVVYGGKCHNEKSFGKILMVKNVHLMSFHAAARILLSLWVWWANCSKMGRTHVCNVSAFCMTIQCVLHNPWTTVAFADTWCICFYIWWHSIICFCLMTFHALAQESWEGFNKKKWRD